ncbi:MAG TPA: hypothetical protein VF483_10145, partial [Gemmatimonadaceae bacterium]
MSIVQDIRYAARSLARRPALVATTTFSLSIAIAANAIMFGIVDRLLLRAPEGVASPAGVQRIYYTFTDNGTPGASSVTTYRVVPALRTVSAFDAVAGIGGNTWTL